MSFTDLDDGWDRQVARAVAGCDPVLVKVFIVSTETDDVVSAATSIRVGPRPFAVADGGYLAHLAPEAVHEKSSRGRGVQHVQLSITINCAWISASGDLACSRTAPAAGNPRRRCGCRV